MSPKIRFIILRIFFLFVAEWIEVFPFLKAYISKTKIRKNRKIDFSWVVSAYHQLGNAQLFEKNSTHLEQNKTNFIEKSNYKWLRTFAF